MSIIATIFVWEGFILLLYPVFILALIKLENKKENWFFLIFLSIFIVVTLYHDWGGWKKPVDFISYVLRHFIINRDPSVALTTEYWMITPSYFFELFSFLIPLSFIGLLSLKREKETLFIILWLIPLTIMTIYINRFSFFLSPALCLLAGVGCNWLEDKYDKIVPFLLIFLTGVVSLGITVQYSPFITNDMIDAFIYIKTHTPEGSTVFNWYSYGFAIETISERETVAKGGRIEWVGRVFLLSNESDIMYYMKHWRYNVGAIYVDNYQLDKERLYYDVLRRKGYNIEVKDFNQTFLHQLLYNDGRNYIHICKAYDNGFSKVYLVD